MLCALTIRTLKPGSFEQFREAFMRHEDLESPPAGYVRFNMIRNAQNLDEVVCFGFFDGSVDELRRTVDERGYAEQLEAIAPFVESARMGCTRSSRSSRLRRARPADERQYRHKKEAMSYRFAYAS